MPRLSGIVIPGLPHHHLTQRGNRRMDVFSEDEDRQRYCDLLHQYAERHGVDIWAYCLMANHVHFVAVPKADTSLARWLRDTHTAYARHVNRRQQESGHLWQGRFFSCVLDEAHLWAAVRYVERNPVKARMVRKAEAYDWSSAQAHCGMRSDPLLAPDFPPANVVADWVTFLRADDPELTAAIQRSTKRRDGQGSTSASSAFHATIDV